MSAEYDAVDCLTRVLVHACRKLGEAGRPEEAGRLAAEAWVVLRAHYPRQALHLDGVMHHAARLEHEREHRNGPTTPAQAAIGTATMEGHHRAHG